jgi:hypothetical protein
MEDNLKKKENGKTTSILLTQLKRLSQNKMEDDLNKILKKKTTSTKDEMENEPQKMEDDHTSSPFSS